jgi:hypothetical protein
MITVMTARVVIMLMLTVMITMNVPMTAVTLQKDAHLLTLTVMTTMNVQMTAVAHILDVFIIQLLAMMKMPALTIHAVLRQVVYLIS